jgi:hypothetical protein
MSDSSADRDPLDRIAEEFVARPRAGPRPAFTGYADRHPEPVEQIRTCSRPWSRREARAAARLHHTNIVPVFGVGEADGPHDHTMPFIGGHPLDGVIDEVKRLKDKSAAVPPAPSRAVSQGAAALVTGTFARTAAAAPNGGDGATAAFAGDAAAAGADYQTHPTAKSSPCGTSRS